VLLPADNVQFGRSLKIQAASFAELFYAIKRYKKMSWLKKIFGSSAVEAGKAVVSTGMTAEEKKAKEEALVAETNIPAFQRRKIDFAYAKSYTMTVRDCPKCNAELVRNYADLVFLTKENGVQSVISAAGYFCPACPTAVFDEKALAQEYGKPDDFSLTVGIDELQPVTFRTLDEEPLSYSFDAGKKIKSAKFVETLKPEPAAGEETDEEKEKKGERRKPTVAEIRKKKKNRSLANKTKRANRKK
jgi:hypothetical protein